MTARPDLPIPGAVYPQGLFIGPARVQRLLDTPSQRVIDVVGSVPGRIGKRDEAIGVVVGIGLRAEAGPVDVVIVGNGFSGIGALRRREVQRVYVWPARAAKMV